MEKIINHRLESTYKEFETRSGNIKAVNSMFRVYL